MKFQLLKNHNQPIATERPAPSIWIRAFMSRALNTFIMVATVRFLPFSIFDICAFWTPISLPRSSCVNFLASRISFIFCPMSHSSIPRLYSSLWGVPCLPKVSSITCSNGIKFLFSIAVLFRVKIQFHYFNSLVNLLLRNFIDLFYKPMSSYDKRIISI